MGRKSGKKGKSTAIVRLPFSFIRYYTTAAAPFNIARLQLRPDQLGDCITAIKDQYQFFRVVDLKLTSVVPMVGSASTSTSSLNIVHAVALEQQFLANLPSSIPQMSELQSFAFGNGFHEPTLHLNSKVLLGQDPLKWFRCDQDDPAAVAAEDFTTQAYLYWAMQSDTTLDAFRHWCYVRGTIEFCQRKDPALDVAGRLMPADYGETKGSAFEAEMLPVGDNYSLVEAPVEAAPSIAQVPVMASRRTSAPSYPRNGVPRPYLPPGVGAVKTVSSSGASIA